MDRIHRIKIDSLNLNDKIIIVKNYILPELFNTIGLNKNNIQITDDTIKYLIRTYTN